MSPTVPHLRRTAIALVAAAALAVVPATTSIGQPGHGHGSHHDPVAKLVKSMSLPEKIGQLFVTYAYGDTATTTDPAYTAQNQAEYGVDNGAELIAKYHLGGIIYFTWANGLTVPTATATLSNGLQAAASSTGAKVPLLISVDQEGGNVVRMGAPLAISPGNMALGAGFHPSDAYAMSRATGQQLHALGINVDDAPVVDTNTNPANEADGARAFGDRPAQTASFGAASVRGYESAKVAATAKHFPGLGSTSTNTDFGYSVSDQTRAEFERNDLPAFRAAIKAGTDEIMAAHIVAPSLDPSEKPASLSKPMVTGILRHQLHYNGVVITDALRAAALDQYTNAQRAVLAVQAGVDQLLMPTDLAGSIQAVQDAVNNGTISEHRIDQSVTRVLTLKERLGLFRSSSVDVGAVDASMGTPHQVAVQDRVARSSITLYRNADGVLPLAENSAKKVLVTGYGASTTQNLANDLASHGVTTSRYVTGSAPSAVAIAAAVTAVGDADYVIDVSYNAWGSEPQRTLADQLRATGKPVVVLAVGAPYELGYQPDTPTFVAAYGYQPPSMVAAADALFGARVSGRSPITIRTPDGSSVVAPYGSGLRYRR